jgi:hypothetical protein
VADVDSQAQAEAQPRQHVVTHEAIGAPLEGRDRSRKARRSKQASRSPRESKGPIIELGQQGDGAHGVPGGIASDDLRRRPGETLDASGDRRYPTEGDPSALCVAHEQTWERLGRSSTGITDHDGAGRPVDELGEALWGGWLGARELEDPDRAMGSVGGDQRPELVEARRVREQDPGPNITRHCARIRCSAHRP